MYISTSIHQNEYLNILCSPISWARFIWHTFSSFLLLPFAKQFRDCEHSRNNIHLYKLEKLNSISQCSNSQDNKEDNSKEFHRDHALKVFVNKSFRSRPSIIPRISINTWFCRIAMDLSSWNCMTFHACVIIHISVSPDQLESIVKIHWICVMEPIQNPLGKLF